MLPFKAAPLAPCLARQAFARHCFYSKGTLHLLLPVVVAMVHLATVHRHVAVGFACYQSYAKGRLVPIIELRKRQACAYYCL